MGAVFPAVSILYHNRSLSLPAVSWLFQPSTLSSCGQTVSSCWSFSERCILMIKPLSGRKNSKNQSSMLIKHALSGGPITTEFLRERKNNARMKFQKGGDIAINNLTNQINK